MKNCEGQEGGGSFESVTHIKPSIPQFTILASSGWPLYGDHKKKKGLHIQEERNI